MCAGKEEVEQGPSTQDKVPQVTHTHVDSFGIQGSEPQQTGVGGITRNFAINWGAIPNHIMAYLQTKQRPPPNVRNKFIRVIMDQVQCVSRNPHKQQISEIAHQIVSKYPSSFVDKLGGDVIGTGQYSLVKAMVDRRDNLNRCSSIQSKKRELQSEAGTPNVKRRPADSYGCLNWQPTIPKQDARIIASKQYLKDVMESTEKDGNKVKEAMNITFPFQRQLINANATVTRIEEEWPYLLTEDGILQHFQILLDIDALTTVKNMVTQKMGKIIKFLSQQSTPQGNEMRILLNQSKEASKEQGTQKGLLVASILMLMIYFKEDKSVLFPLKEVRFECLCICVVNIYSNALMRAHLVPFQETLNHLN